MSRVYLAVVVDDTDPKQQGRVLVQCPALLEQPFWARPRFAVATPWAIPTVDTTVAVESSAPGDYVWTELAPSPSAEPPGWARDEYPQRRALVSRDEASLVGLDSVGKVYLGHFGATERAVLGDALVSKLTTALQNIETALGSIRNATYGTASMDPASQAVVQTAISGIQGVRTALGDVLSARVYVAKDEGT
jgi:hypothetical protein